MIVPITIIYGENIPKVTSRQNSGLEQLAWHQVRQEVHAVNPELATIIDDISPGDDLPLFKAIYPYGSNILKRGVLQLHNSFNELVPWDSPTISSFVQKSLGYNFGTNPVSLLLAKTVEIFFVFDNKTIPLYGLMPPGSVFSTWKVLSVAPSHGPAFLWNMTAGARSIVMLPPIAERAAHTKLCKQLRMNISKPETLLSQWQVFKEVINSDYSETHWSTEILLFGGQWFEHLLDDRFSHFQRYLYYKAWEGSNHFRHQFIWDLIFSLAQQQKHIKFDPYIINTVEHLLMISIGVMPGFGPAVNDNAAPVSKLQAVYREIYGLKKYAPIMFHLQQFDMNQADQHVYYSLGYPTTMRFSPRNTKITTRLNDLTSIKLAMQKYLQALSSSDYNIAHTQLSKLPQLVDYEYYHNTENNYNIKPCQDILNNDKILKTLVDDEGRLATNSPFLQGSIQLLTSSKS